MRWSLGFLALVASAGLFAGEPEPVETPPEPEGVVGPQHDGQENFVPLFNGRDLTGWAGALKGYTVKDGVLACRPESGGRIYTEEEYADFVLRFEFKLSPGANSGLSIRTPPGGEGAKDGMEIQILDDSSPLYRNMPAWYKHGAIFGVAPAKPGHLRPVGEWNTQQVIARGTRVVVKLNGTIILNADLAPILESGRTADGRGVMAAHAGLHRKSGRIGFIGSGSKAEFRDVWIKVLK
ncbi:MAG TPA: DUF1080 domain-containing protein [Planctomycetota bacterium]|nr:DUF1080 domain-containing protein [Planctomycetota bacterium]